MPMILVVLVILLTSVLFNLIPGLTRPDLFFAVTVAPEFRRTPDAQRILRRFRVIVWTFTLVAIAVQLATNLVLVSILILMAAYLWALVNGHHRVLAFAAAPSSTVEVDLAAPDERLPGGLILPLLPILSMVGLGIWASLNLDRLPQRLPVHWGLEGPDRWVATTSASVLGFLALHTLLCVFLAGSAWALLNWSRRISTSGPTAAAERHFRRRVVQLIIVAEYFVAAPAWFALFQPTPLALNAWAGALTITMLAFAVSLLRAGQGGSREAPATAAVPEGDHTPDACWKWGLFYVNPADPALLIEKRFGVGYTVNFGNRWSWALLVLILAPVAVGLIFLRR